MSGWNDLSNGSLRQAEATRTILSVQRGENVRNSEPVRSKTALGLKGRKLDDTGTSEINRLYPESRRKDEKDREEISEFTPPCGGRLEKGGLKGCPKGALLS
ncbi:hypothetical protein TNCV_4572431 [Trichonephila clavipes]|nr:hypothetical protein TNCV_4572431 [Trichonephila clavipes]